MAEQSGFFDAHLINGEYDRVYLAEHFAKYFASFIGNGVFGGKSNELMVRQKETPSMGVRVLSGQAWIDGYWYENDAEHLLTIDVADGVLHRIDSIVVRWNHSERIIRLAVKKGVAATNPIAPVVQRDDDYYELKLADIYIKAGTTSITQSSITDKRLNTNECGLVIGVVQQLDADEFGIQLETYISEFIAEHNTWKNTTKANTEQWANEFKTSYTNWFTQFKAECNTAVNNLIAENQTKINKLLSDGQTNIGKVVSDGTTSINNLIVSKTSEIDNVIQSGQQRFDDVIEELEEVAENNDIASIVLDVNTLKTDNSTIKSSVGTLTTDVSKLKQDNDTTKQDIETLKKKVEEPNGMGIEDETEIGCYYVEAADGAKEWINPPSKPGLEYRTLERWNGNPVYQTTIYAAALPNKTVMSVHVGAYFDEIISITGFAIDSDNNMHYQFPIILNGLTPAAVISFAEGDGGDGSDIAINTNDDLSTFKAYITVKYTKSK